MSLDHAITWKHPENVSPIRQDPPGAVTSMPSPTKIHHVHIYSDVNYDAMIQFYKDLFNAEIVNATREGKRKVTFLAYDDHDHRLVIIRQPGWGTKPQKPVGMSHIAFGYASLGELLYVYKRMRTLGYPRPPRSLNHGNSTSLYWKDPDGNDCETLVDNFTPQECQDYKRYYQFTDEFGAMNEGNFDVDKMLALYEAGVPDTVLMDREQVRAMRREGRL
ncbi:MAG TPA: VOC family protein [Stellaceae bacterium]|jgi:catechol-2,3-dioxygenase|nr:VOC family protein [Stellaceae bacterium]